MEDIQTPTLTYHFLEILIEVGTPTAYSVFLLHHQTRLGSEYKQPLDWIPEYQVTEVTSDIT